MSGVRNRAKQSELLRNVFRDFMKDVCTSIPGHILTFDPVTQLAQVKVGIQRVDVNDAVFEVAPIIETPVYMPGGDYHVEYQIDQGCEGDILFSQRCIDGWVNSGGVAANPIGRFHNMQDAFFLPGFRSKPGALPAFQNNGIRLSNKQGTQFVWLKNDNSISADNGQARFNILPDGSTLMQNALGSFRLMTDGSFLINGLTITPDGNIITALGVNLDQHTHYASDNVTPLTGKPIV